MMPAARDGVGLALLSLALLSLALMSLAACTPVRSTLSPPYVVAGNTYDTAGLEAHALATCAAASEGQTLPSHRFTTDGCSAWREGRKDQDWQSCCIQHDIAYWCGASRRREADRQFRRCVAAVSTEANARLMYTGVRLGGGRFVPFPWRFGYGHPWPHHAPVEPVRPAAVHSEAAPQISPTDP